jgi:glycosyltransferase involved in cell wall biosynthesis
MSGICAVIVARDEAYFLPLTLPSVRALADHVFVLDTGSVDGTVDYLQDSGVNFEQRDFGGAYRFDGGSYTGSVGSTDRGPYREMEARNYALDRAAELFAPDWIIRMDADESFHASLFEEMRTGSADAIGFGCEMPVAHTPFMINRDPQSMHGGNLHDPHVFAWRETKARARWEHPPKSHVCLSGLPSARFIDHPVHFHYHRAFGPKSIYTYIYWQASFGGASVGYGARDWMGRPEITASNFRDDKIYRQIMPERFDDQGRFIVPKSVSDYFLPHAMQTDYLPDAHIIEAYRQFITFEGAQ